MDPSKSQHVHVFNALRLASPLFAIGMAHLPVGLMVSILTGIGATYAQTAFLQIPSIRRKLGIAPLPENPPKLPSLLESRMALKVFLEEGQRKAAEQAQQAERDARRNKK